MLAAVSRADATQTRIEDGSFRPLGLRKSNPHDNFSERFPLIKHHHIAGKKWGARSAAEGDIHLLGVLTDAERSGKELDFGVAVDTEDV